jgi:WD40 repeat protein
VDVWSLGGQLVRTLPHNGPVQSIAVSPDGKWIVAGVGSRAFAWDAAASADAPAHELAGHSAEITSLVFAPDGDRLFTASRDFTVKLWDANAWRELLTLGEHTDSVVSVSLFASPTHPSLLTAGAEGQALLWPTVSWRD